MSFRAAEVTRAKLLLIVKRWGPAASLLHTGEIVVSFTSFAFSLKSSAGSIHEYCGRRSLEGSVPVPT
jgi:hypothetical protein